MYCCFLQILTLTGKITEGIALLERALHLDPSSKIIQQDLLRLQAKQKQDVQKERSLYKKMFQLDSPAASSTTPKGKPKTKLTVSHQIHCHLISFGPSKTFDWILNCSVFTFRPGAMDVDDWCYDSCCGQLRYLPLQTFLNEDNKRSI